MKKQISLITLGIVIIIALFITCQCFHSNNIQNVQVVQAIDGTVSIRNDGGIYSKVFPRIWTYAKTRQVAFSFVQSESKDNDGIHVFFANKGQGDVSTQITYSLLTEKEKVLKMHELAQGDDDVIDRRILATIREITMREAGLITSSEAIEKREEFADKIRKVILHNPDFMLLGIDITQFTITDIKFDDLTIAAYKKAQEADLQKKTAEAEKLNFVMQKEKTIAQYEQQVAESKGKAEVEKMKAVTDAERQKELAEIKAKQEVVVAELIKQQATIEANKKLEVAEIQKKEEAARLEVIKIQADQKVAAAKAKEQEIKLSGAISEAEKVKLEIEMNTKIGVAQALADGIGKLKLPETMILGTGTNTNNNPVENLLNLMIIEKSKELQTRKN